jgi:two-component sensor histidine kinase
MTFTPEDRDKGIPAAELGAAFRDGAAPNVRYHLRKDGRRVFIEGSVTALRGPDGRIRGFLQIGQDVTARKAAEERQALLMREVDHRAKNALSVVSAALRLTRAPDLPSYMKAIEGRIAALARAQTLLADDRWAGADLRTLLRGELATFLDVGAAGGPRVEASGPPVTLPAGAAQPLAMAIHELATNAIKYGALSTPTGCIAIHWEKAGWPSEMLRLHWVERGGPRLEAVPERRGFGTRVLDKTVRGQLGGTVSLAWNASGLVCELEMPLRPKSEIIKVATAPWAD